MKKVFFRYIMICTVILLNFAMIGCSSKTNFHNSYIGTLPVNYSEIIDDLTSFVIENYPPDTSLRLDAEQNSFGIAFENSLRKAGFIISETSNALAISYQVSEMSTNDGIYVIAIFIEDKKETRIASVYDINTGEKLSPISYMIIEKE